ncbi:MAG: glycosyltransferase family 4 protein [Clostridia bacterium]|nr:glycosyltransferase family 4 protein [Clostridia bacterium]
MSKIAILGNLEMGLLLFRREIIEGLVREGHQVYAVSPEDGYTAQLEELGCKVCHVNLSRHGMNPLSELKLMMAYVKLFKKLKPDMVFSFSIKPNLYGGMACRLLKIPCVPNITGLGVALQNDTTVRKVLLAGYKVALKKSPVVFFQNSANLNFFREKGIVKDNFILLPGSGVNLQRNCFEEYPEDDGVTSFLFLGRIMRDKGVREYIEASKLIKEKYPHTRFIMVGELEKDYAEEFERLDAQSFVELYEKTDDPHSFITRADAVVVPSYHEGMSNVSLEAAAAGRPIISSRIHGCMEVVDDGVNGFSFTVKDEKALAQVMEKFIELPHSAKEQMGKEGRKKVEREFDRQRVVDEYIKIAR